MPLTLRAKYVMLVHYQLLFGLVVARAVNSFNSEELGPLRPLDGGDDVALGRR